MTTFRIDTKMKTIISILIIIIGLVITSCSENPAEPTLQEIISGAYQMNGTQIEYQYAFPWTDKNVISTDTTQFEFILYIEFNEFREDTIRFRELPGVNTGEYRSLPPQEQCSSVSGDCAYAKLQNNQVELHFDTYLGKYDAEGTLEDGKLMLNGTFTDRGVEVDYILEGMKVEED